MSTRDYSDNRITFTDLLFDLALKGTKTTTTRLGVRNYVIGPGIIQNSTKENHIKIEITNITIKVVKNLTDEDARKEGYANRYILYSVLQGLYRDMNIDDLVTIVEFRVKSYRGGIISNQVEGEDVQK